MGIVARLPQEVLVATSRTPSPDPLRSMRGKRGALKSWAQTPDRTARTRNARASSPTSPDYWLARQDPEKFAGATDEQRWAAAEAAVRMYMAELNEKAIIAKRAKAAERAAARAHAQVAS